MNKIINKEVSLEETFTTFSPRDYLDEYYVHLGNEEDNLLRFFLYAYSFIPNNVCILEFGGGPTLYQLITAVTKVKEVYFSDYLEVNLYEVEKWKELHREAFNWDSYIKRVLQLEGNTRITKINIENRKELIRSKLKKFLYCDAFKNNPLGDKYRNFFDVVSSNFTAESISKNREEWEITMKNICSLIKPNGFLIMTALKGAKYWHAGNRKFPAANIDEVDVSRILSEIGFQEKTIYMQSFDADTLHETEEGSQGFKGVICVIAQKSNK